MRLGYISYMVQTCEEKTYRHFGFQQMWRKQLLQPSKLDSTVKTEGCLLDIGGGIFLKGLLFDVSYPGPSVHHYLFMKRLLKNRFAEV